MRPSTRTRAAAGIVAALALSLAAVAPVAADAPAVETRHFEVTRDIPGFLDCGDYLGSKARRPTVRSSIAFDRRPPEGGRQAQTPGGVSSTSIRAHEARGG
jgi:hypothetical protein